MLLLDAPSTREALTFARLIPTLRAAFVAGACVPLRHAHVLGPDTVADGRSLIMPAWDDEFYGVKVVNIFPTNRERGLPGLHSSYLLHDVRTGVPLALIDGDELTSRRTAAASALGASFLAGTAASTLLVVGAGRVGSLIAAAMRVVRPIERVMVWDIDATAASRCADSLARQGFQASAVADLEPAARAADIVSCATLATEPVVQGEWLAPGSHLDLIGSFTPQMQEADPACFAGARVMVDTDEAPTKSGDLLRAFDAGALARSDVAGDLAALCRGTVAGRTSASQRTVFKAVGTALEDLAAAVLAYRHHQSDPVSAARLSR